MTAIKELNVAADWLLPCYGQNPIRAKSLYREKHRNKNGVLSKLFQMSAFQDGTKSRRGSVQKLAGMETEDSTTKPFSVKASVHQSTDSYIIPIDCLSKN